MNWDFDQLPRKLHYQQSAAKKILISIKIGTIIIIFLKSDNDRIAGKTQKSINFRERKR